MENIWAFLLQTLTVSVVAALILFIKWLFQDKLSPRWQYGVWIVLLLRIIFPAQIDKALFFNLSVWIETIKGMVEQNLQSVYTNAFETLNMDRVLPTITQAPTSITDWLFVIYVAGIVAMLLWYMFSYIRLRLLLRKGEPASYEQQHVVAQVCSQYDLTACKTVAVQGLPSAFVCGIVHPVLALPANVVVDEKIILHELLHLQYKDALRNVGWCFVRAFHWCNPFLQMVFRRIGNDMESLCDQRVLERLDGEERRAYGNILLDMANNQYARAPGTTSISNGGKNISRRIAAIVRFKKYPKGMALVSVCIVMVLTVPALAGTELTYTQSDYEPKQLHELDKAMALARLNRCTTVAGALDTYAKGLLLENGVYIASATPVREHAALYERMRKANTEEGWAAYHLDSGAELEYAYYDYDYGYTVYSLERINDNLYTAVLAFQTKGFPANDDYKLRDEDGNIYHQGIVYIPVTVRNSHDGWVVQENGEREMIVNGCGPYGNIEPEYEPALRLLHAHGKTGDISLKLVVETQVDNRRNADGSWNGRTDFDTLFKPAAAYRYTRDVQYVFYDTNSKEIENGPVNFAAFQVKYIWPDSDMPTLDSYVSGYFSEDGGDYFTHSKGVYGENWDGVLMSGASTNFYQTHDSFVLPKAYLIGIYWDGNLVEQFLIEEAETAEEGVRGDLLREFE